MSNHQIIYSFKQDLIKPGLAILHAGWTEPLLLWNLESSHITQFYHPNNPVSEDFMVDTPLVFKDYKKSGE